MNTSFPVLTMSYEQIALLTAQLLVYQQYLQRQKAAPSMKRNRTLRVLAALLQRLGSIVWSSNQQTALLLTVEEVLLMKEALIVLRTALESKPASAKRDHEIQHLVTMKRMLDQTFPTIQPA